MSPYYALLTCCALLLATATTQAQSASPPQVADSIATGVARVSSASPELPWWLPNAQECAATRAEEARTQPSKAHRRQKRLRQWAQELPEPAISRP